MAIGSRPRPALFVLAGLLLACPSSWTCEARLLSEEYLLHNWDTAAVVLVAVAVALLLRKLCRGRRRDDGLSGDTTGRLAAAEEDLLNKEFQKLGDALAAAARVLHELDDPVSVLWRMSPWSPAAAAPRGGDVALSPLPSSSPSSVPGGGGSPDTGPCLLPLQDASPAEQWPLREFNHRSLAEATASFDAGKVLGRGRSGVVYAGSLLWDDGTKKDVAVKMLHRAVSRGRVRDDLRRRKYSIRHRNLVTLLGYGLHKRRLYLVNARMHHGSLDDALFAQTDDAVLRWDDRYSIVKDTAQGLYQLHVRSVFHGAVKASNIMLEPGPDGWRARLGDFRYSKLLAGHLGEAASSTTSAALAPDQSTATEAAAGVPTEGTRWGHIYGRVSSVDVGCGYRRISAFLGLSTREAASAAASLEDPNRSAETTGMLQPEQALPCATAEPCIETDVLDLGAVILEAVCGRRRDERSTGSQLMVDWVRALREEGRLRDAVDKKLAKELDTDQAVRLLHLGLACSHPDPERRPAIHGVCMVLAGGELPPETR